MNLSATDHPTAATLERQMRAEGVSTLQDVSLPDVFEPPLTDVVFIAIDGMVEVFISSELTYRGRSEWWQEVQASPEQPGRSRFLGRVRGGIREALELWEMAVREAGGSLAPAHEGDQSSDADGHAAPGRLRDMTREHRDTRLVGRDEPLEQLTTALLRQTKPGVLLMGPAGCGKTAIVEILAGQIARQEVPAALQGVSLYDLPLGSLLEEAQMVGGIERQVAELIDLPGRPVFFVDEIHQLARRELRPVMDLLKPALASGRIRVIGATTPGEWRQIQDPAFRRRFTTIDIPEPTPRETLKMLRMRVQSLSEHHSVEFDEEDLRRAIALAARYLPSRAFPDKAIDLLDHAAAMQASRAATRTISIDDTGR